MIEFFTTPTPGVARMRRALMVALAMAPVPSLHAQTAPRMRIGMNVNWINMYGTGAIHNDALVAAGPNNSPAWNGVAADGKTVVYAPDGTPPPVGFHANAATGAYARPGEYTLKATGKGSLQVKFLPPNGSKVVLGTLPASGVATFTGKETYTFTFPPDNPAYVNLTVLASDATTPLNHIQLLTPGAGRGLYHPEYVSALKPFDCIRVMD